MLPAEMRKREGVERVERERELTRREREREEVNK